MNYIRHLTGFFQRVSIDTRLNATHISIYMAIFQFWNVSRFKNPISISRSEIMDLSKVSSKNTYHKCMKELHKFRYIQYEPSYHPLKGSSVHVISFSNESLRKDQCKIQAGDDQVTVGQEAGGIQDEDKTAAESEADPVSSAALNSIKHMKHKKLALKNISDADEKKNFSGNPTGRLAAKDAAPREIPLDSVEKVPENLDAVKRFFSECNYPEEEALKFFHYFSSCGWKVGGKAPMANWHAAAHNWMLNARKLNDHATHQRNPGQDTCGRKLNTRSDKDYSQPL